MLATMEILSTIIQEYIPDSFKKQDYEQLGDCLIRSWDGPQTHISLCQYGEEYKKSKHHGTKDLTGLLGFFLIDSFSVDIPEGDLKAETCREVLRLLFKYLYPMEILDIVILNEFNNTTQYGYVLSKPCPELFYEEVRPGGSHSQIALGSEETYTFYQVYSLEIPRGSKQMGAYAFGGREFDLPKRDGTVIHCWGQYWDGGCQATERYLGKKLTRFSYCPYEDLKQGLFYIDFYIDEEKFKWMLQRFEAKHPDYIPLHHNEYLDKLKSKESKSQ